jgi:hypothetical protein
MIGQSWIQVCLVRQAFGLGPDEGITSGACGVMVGGWLATTISRITGEVQLLILTIQDFVKLY